MHIAINCSDLDHQRIDGTRVYIKNCLDLFGKFDDMTVFNLYHKKEFNPELKPKIYPNYKDQKIPYPVWWTQTRFGFEINFTLPDVCWMPIQQVPFLANPRTKIVITIHDLAFKYFPKSFSLKDRIKLDFFTETAVKRADKIIAVSDSTKRDILKFYPKTNPQKIKVIYHGINAGDFSKKFSSSKIKEVLGRYKIGKNYLLYVGAIQPRKNLETLIEAFDDIKSKEPSDLQLVIVGDKAWKFETIFQKIEKSKFKKDIILTGKISFQDLPIFYQQSRMFIFPSLYEGFGIPILEAWAARTPVIVADNSSLSEIGGEAVLKFKSLDKKDLVEKINKIQKYATIKKELLEKGAKCLEKFSWEKCAKETLEFIKTKKC